MGREMKPYQTAKLRPYLVVKVYWSCVHRDPDPSKVFDINAYAWMGWMCAAPEDWDGVIPELESLAPAGSVVKEGHWKTPEVGSEENPPFSVNLMFPRKPSGLNAPWLASEECFYQVIDSDRICLVDLHWRFEEKIPSRFDQSWQDKMNERAFSVKEEVELTLKKLNFKNILFMGVHHDLVGEDHWSNLSERLYPKWIANDEQIQLSETVQCGKVLINSNPRSL